MKFGKIREFNYLKVLIPLDVFIYRDIKIGEKIYEEDEGIDKFLERYPLVKEGNYLKLVIDIDEGYVSNWPNNCAIDLHDIKVCDEGIYALMQYEDGSGDYLEYHGYVPQIIGEGGYGDYLEFEIDDFSDIIDWDEFTEEDLEEFERKKDDE